MPIDYTVARYEHAEPGRWSYEVFADGRPFMRPAPKAWLSKAAAQAIAAVLNAEALGGD